MDSTAMRRDAALEVSTEVCASPDVVWALLSDLSRMGEWSPECTGVRWRGGAPGARPGTRFSGRNRKGLWRWSTKCTVVAALPGRELAWTVSFFGSTSGEPGWRIAIVDPADDMNPSAAKPENGPNQK